MGEREDGSVLTIQVILFVRGCMCICMFFFIKKSFFFCFRLSFKAPFYRPGIHIYTEILSSIPTTPPPTSLVFPQHRSRERMSQMNKRRSSRISPFVDEDSSFISLSTDNLVLADFHDNNASRSSHQLISGVTNSVDELTINGSCAIADDNNNGNNDGGESTLRTDLNNSCLGVANSESPLPSALKSTTTLPLLVSPSPQLSTPSNKNLLRPKSNMSDYNKSTSQINSATASVNSNLTKTPLKNPSYIPPWTEPYIIGIAGNSGSGKTSISQQIIQGINQPWTVLLSFDNFYKSLTPEQSKRAFANDYDFDTPDSLDIDAIVEVVENLKQGRKATIPCYSFAKHARLERTNTIYGANVVILEGLYALYDERLSSMMDLKIYVDTDLDVCLARRLTRDILYRGRDLEGAMKQWDGFVKPNAVKFLNPTMRNADVVIPRGLDNTIAIELMIKHIKNQLAMKSARHLQNLKNLGINMEFNVDDHANIGILAPTNQVKGINSILFNKDTLMNDFIFYFNRMCGLLIEFAQQNYFVTAKPLQITTTEGYKYDGVQFVQKQIVAINIIRSGDCFMWSLKKSFAELTIGKMLIQSDSTTGEPQLHYESLPSNVGDIGKIMLFDSQVISGAGAIMAIQVLIDHKVREEDIILVTYLSTEIGIRRIINVFPNVKIVIGKLSTMDPSKLDPKSNNGCLPWYNTEGFLDSHWHFRHRFIDSLYFGTQ